MLGYILAIFVIISTTAFAERVITPPQYSDMSTGRLSTIECLSVNAYHEARGESDLANIMIMNVVMNRVNDVRFPDTVCNVIFAKSAFEWTQDGKSDKVTNTSQYRRLYLLSELYLSNKGVYLNLSEGVNHYHNKNISPYWSKAKGYNYITTIDNHKFYTWEK